MLISYDKEVLKQNSILSQSYLQLENETFAAFVLYFL